MDLTTATALVALALLVLLAGVVMITRRFLVVGQIHDGKAMAALAAELKRANDLAEKRIDRLEARIGEIERQNVTHRQS